MLRRVVETVAGFVPTEVALDLALPNGDDVLFIEPPSGFEVTDMACLDI